MKCYEVKESTLSEFDRLYAHGVNVREFGSCPVCDDLNKPMKKVIDVSEKVVKGLNNKWWKFW
jgi:hypothetical protein